MKNKILLIFSYLFTLVEAISLLLLVVLLVFNVTIFDSNYVIRMIDKTDYNDNLFEDIKKEMSYYTNQSGFSDSVLDNTFKKSDVRSDTNLLISNMYKGEETKINCSNLKESFNDNINEFLYKYNYTITSKEDIDSFTNKMADIYVSKIKVIDNSDKIFMKIKRILDIKDIAIIGLLLLFAIMLLLNNVICHVNSLDIVVYIDSILLLVARIYIINKIDIKNLYLYNENISAVLRNVIINVLNCYLVIIIMFFIIGLVLSICSVEKKKRIRH
ncbi:MAG: hypothetical protein IKF19_04975 [Bacilli bacterium]|nr:hypothetical protein [Bacilli bacterium]